jgi:hypothetical protein
LKSLIDTIRSSIAKNWNFEGELRGKLKNFKSKDDVGSDTGS